MISYFRKKNDLIALQIYCNIVTFNEFYRLKI